MAGKDIIVAGYGREHDNLVTLAGAEPWIFAD